MLPRQGTEALVGRRWAVERIESWLSSDDHALVVTGPAGTGKSALVTAVAAGQPGPTGDPNRFHAVHRCQRQVTSSTDPIGLLGSVAAQLARTVPGYRALLRGPRRDEPGPADLSALAAALVLESVNPSAAYDRALRLPLGLLAPRSGGHEVVVVVDGLDEAAQGSAGLVDLLAGHLAAPVPGLRLLLTMRSDGTAHRLPATSTFDLVGDCPAGVDDVADYLDAVGGLAAPTRAAVAQAAAGSYVYADVVGRLAATGAGFADGLPPGLDALYGLALDEIGEPDSLARLVLSVLARSKDDGFTVDQLAGILDAEASWIAAAVERSRPLLAGEHRIRPHHRCLSEYLLATSADPGAVDWMIARYLQQGGSGRWQAGSETYALRNLMPHLADAAGETEPVGRSVAAGEAMRDLAGDPAYVSAAVLEVGVDDVLCALAYVDRSAHCPPRDAVTLARIMRRQAGALRTARERHDPALAVQQLVFEAATVGERTLGRGFAGRFPDDGILTLWATSDSPLRLLPDAMKGHRTAVASVLVTGDGTRAVTTSKDRETRVWQLASGRLVHTLPTPAPVSNMYAEPGTSRVVASTTDGRAQVWDAAVGASVARQSGGRTARVTAFAVNADGTLGAGGDWDGNTTIWDLTRGEPVVRLPRLGGLGSLVNAIALSPDGRAVATASLGNGVTVWDLKTAAPTHRLPVVGVVTSLALSPDARWLLVGGDGLGGYALANGEPPRLLGRLVTCHPVSAVAFNVSMPMYVLFGGASGQVGYVRLPTERS